MKKIIYIFLLGLVFVACDKNDDGLDIQSITPQEIAEVDATVNLTSRFNAFNKLVSGIELPKNSVSASANKGGDNGANWLELQWFTSGDEGYVYLRPDTLGNGCNPSAVTNHYKETYTLVSSTEINIQVGDGASQTFAVPETLRTRYGQVFNSEVSSIFFADQDDASRWSVRFGAIPTVTVVD